MINYETRYKGTCTCGWKGQKQDNEIIAYSDAQIHFREVHSSGAKINTEKVKVLLPKA